RSQRLLSGGRVRDDRRGDRSLDRGGDRDRGLEEGADSRVVVLRRHGKTSAVVGGVRGSRGGELTVASGRTARDADNEGTVGQGRASGGLRAGQEVASARQTERDPDALGRVTELVRRGRRVLRGLAGRDRSRTSQGQVVETVSGVGVLLADERLGSA